MLDESLSVSVYMFWTIDQALKSEKQSQLTVNTNCSGHLKELRSNLDIQNLGP